MLATNGIAYEREQGPVDSNQRPADILLKRWKDDVDVAMDITVHHPIGVRAICTVDGTTTSMQEAATRKERLYTSLCRQHGWDFCPMVFDTWGGIHGKGLAMWKAFTHAATAGHPLRTRSTMVAHLRG